MIILENSLCIQSCIEIIYIYHGICTLLLKNLTHHRYKIYDVILHSVVMIPYVNIKNVN